MVLAVRAIGPGPALVSRCPWGTDWEVCSAEDSDRKSPNDQGRKHSRGRARSSLARLLEKTRLASEKDKEPQARNVSNYNKNFKRE